MTLIKASLNAIPLCTLSFYKASAKIIQESRSILSNFLWSVLVNKRGIHWVNWETVCKPKDRGGLGVRVVGQMNRAFLIKWKWRILKEDNAIWSRFFRLRYKNPKLKVQAACGEVINVDDSIWWRDIILNDIKAEGSEIYFSSCV